MICVSSRWGKPWRCQGREGRSGNDWYARSTKDRLPIEARSPCERCASFAASPPLRPRPRSFCRANRASAQIGISKLQFGQMGADGNCDHALNPISLPTAHATLSAQPEAEGERGERDRVLEGFRLEAQRPTSTLDHHLSPPSSILTALGPTLSSKTPHPPSTYNLASTHHSPPKSAWTTGPPTVSMTAPHPRRLQTTTTHHPQTNTTSTT